MSEERKPSLPYGWRTSFSKKYPDRIYYFNVHTGASTWECPALEYKENSAPEHGHPSILRLEPQNGLLLSKDDTVNSIEAKETRVREVTVSKNGRLVLFKRPAEATVQSINATDENVRSLNNPPTAIVSPVILKKEKSSPNSTQRVLSNTKVTCTPPRNRASNEFRKIPLLPTPPLQKGMKRKSSPEAFSSEERSKASSHIVERLKFSRIPEKDPAERTRPVSHIEQRLLSSRPSAKCMNQPSTSSDSTSSGEFSYEGSDLEMFSPSEHEEAVCSPQNSMGYAFKEASTTDAENNSIEDIEMLDVSTELTKIDDLAATAEATHSSSSYYIVVDTNIFISHLSDIDEMKDTPIDGCGPPHFIIPWIVLQELDNLKRQSVKPNVFRASCDAVRYLNTVLKSKHPRFHGQSPQEAKDCKKDYSVNNDDKLLECCMSLTEKMPQEKVMLLTNDKNLTNKALICDINVHDWVSFVKVLKPEGKSKKKSKKSGKANSTLNTTQLLSKQKDIQKFLVEQRTVCDNEIHTLMSNARQILKDVLQPFLEEEMKEAYGEPWEHFKIERHLLRGILDAVLRYWRMVFSFYFKVKELHFKEIFQLLRDKAVRPEGFLGNKEECLEILTAIEEIFGFIQKKWTHLDVHIKEIMDIKASCLETFHKYSDIDLTISQVESACVEVEKENVFKVFDYNWATINHLVGMALDYNNLPHNIEYVKPEVMPGKDEFYRVMPKLYKLLKSLKEIMKSVQEVIAKPETNRPKLFKKLAAALREFVPSLHIEMDDSRLPQISAAGVQSFCFSPENRERMEIGSKQLDDYFAKLDEALQVLLAI